MYGVILKQLVYVWHALYVRATLAAQTAPLLAYTK